MKAPLLRLFMAVIAVTMAVCIYYRLLWAHGMLAISYSPMISASTGTNLRPLIYLRVTAEVIALLFAGVQAALFTAKGPRRISNEKKA